jgi:large subunit ribosomal protein L3
MKGLDGLIGKKLGMSQVYTNDGRTVPVTVVTAGPCRVVQKRTKKTNGYEAVQLSFEEVEEKKLNKPVRGQFKKAQVPPARYLREFKGNPEGLEIGAIVTVDLFKKGERVDVTGISKGKGFAGVVKRHHFAGGPATHGSMFHRAPGSIGSSSWPSRVWKGKRLGGHMGSERVTVKSLEIIDVRQDENLLFIEGAVPGSPGTLLLIHRSKGKWKEGQDA